jgi:hypothetical protein
MKAFVACLILFLSTSQPDIYVGDTEIPQYMGSQT